MSAQSNLIINLKNMFKNMYPKDLLDLSERLSELTDAEATKLIQESDHKQLKGILEEGPTDLAVRFRSRVNEVISDVNSFGKARIHALSRQVGVAKKEFEKSISDGFQVGDSYNSLGLIESDNGNFGKAVEYQKLAAENGFYPARINLANIYFMFRKYDLAKAELEKVFKLGDECLTVLYACANQMKDTGNLDLAIFIFEFLVEKNIINAMETLCKLYYSLGDENNYLRMVDILDQHGFSVTRNPVPNDVN